MRMPRWFGFLSLAAPLLAAPPPAPAGYQWVRNEAFSDEFNGPALDATKWFDHHPWWVGRPPAMFKPWTLSLQDGCLRIRNALLPGPEQGGKFTIAGGAIVSRSDQGHYGYYEVRMKASSLSMSSTFWLTNRAVPVPGGSAKQEIDIQETVGRGKKQPERRHFMKSNTHYFDSPQGGERKDLSVPGDWRMETPADEAFHEYGAWWVDANTVHYYCDGTYRFMLRPNATRSPTPLNRPMYLNLVTETYHWETPPTPEELADDTRNTTYYDWVRSYVLVPVPPSPAR